VVVAEHPLHGRECAALVLTAAGALPVERWEAVAGRLYPEGYTVEVGVAGFGSVAAYENGVIFESDGADLPGSPSPFWFLVGTAERGDLALCSVGPQHHMCRTWLGRTTAGEVATVVTDLGLLELDPTDFVPGWLAERAGR
jgi:hypothetical protein